MYDIEVKIFDIDIEATLAKLQDLGATYVGEKLLSAVLLDTPRRDLVRMNGSLRLRKENDRSIITYKTLKSKNEFKSIKEIEVEVTNYEKAKELLFAMGYSNVYRSYQKKRFEFHLKNAVVYVDKYLNEFEKIPVFIEIEAQTEQEILKTLELLGIDRSKAKNYALSDLIRIYIPQPKKEPERNPNSQRTQVAIPTPYSAAPLNEDGYI